MYGSNNMKKSVVFNCQFIPFFPPTQFAAEPKIFNLWP
jgi:hypothetical protein